MYLLLSLNIDQFCHFCVFYLPLRFPSEYLKIKSQASNHFTHNFSGVRFTRASFYFCYYSWTSVVFCLHRIPFSVEYSSFPFENCLLQFDDAIQPLASLTPCAHDSDWSGWVFLWGVSQKLRMKALLHENMGLKNPISLELQKGSTSEKAHLDMILIQKEAR